MKTRHRVTNPSRSIALSVLLGTFLGACAGPGELEHAEVTRSAGQTPLVAAPQSGAAPVQLASGRFSISTVRVEVPRSLSVSEAQSIKPRAHILWQEEPLGDRHAQVDRIVTRALEAGTTDIGGAGRAQSAVLDVTLHRFHAVTPITRKFFGGQHEIDFTFRLIDPRSGTVLYGPEAVSTEFAALSGAAARRAEAKGQTQAVRIHDHLAALIRERIGKL